jgi:uncharacterized protein YjbJ (UPF0337 family)
MKWDRIEGDWLRLKGNAKRQWPKLTNVDLIIGKRACPADYIQERYGYSKSKMEGQLANRQGRQTEICQPL